MLSLATIDKDELKALIDQGQAFIGDANASRRYLKGHIPGAANLDPADYTKDDLPADEAKPLVFYCTGGLCGAARYAAKRAIDMGYRDVRLFTGGIGEWEKAGLPLETGGVPAWRPKR